MDTCWTRCVRHLCGRRRVKNNLPNNTSGLEKCAHRADSPCRGREPQRVASSWRDGLALTRRWRQRRHPPSETRASHHESSRTTLWPESDMRHTVLQCTHNTLYYTQYTVLHTAHSVGCRYNQWWTAAVVQWSSRNYRIGICIAISNCIGTKIT